MMSPMSLEGVRVLDLSRVLAGPSATQMLGDLGADVVKVEKPGEGDDTRRWGPPFVAAADGAQPSESTYYLSANRNKRSIEIDLADPAGQSLVLELLGHADVLVENYKVGGLAAYGLAYPQLKDRFPRLVYCSITGFGQNGPYAHRAGYDFLVQAMGGIMSLTGAPDGEPMKVGVAVADVMAGMHAAIGILAALRHRDRTGEGQHVDISLLDSQISWLVNSGTAALLTGQDPPRMGNGHPSIVPYQVFNAADGPMVLAIGNDRQFRKFCQVAGLDQLADDPRYHSNTARVAHRESLVEQIGRTLLSQPRAFWMAHLDAQGVPCGPVNTLGQVFADPHVRERGSVIEMPYPGAADGKVRLLANPIRMSETPPSYRQPPPMLGEHAADILAQWLGAPSAAPDTCLGIWTEMRAMALPIRIAVFVKEQGVPEHEEADDLDELSLHAVVRVGGVPAATGRLCPDGRIGRMAVLRRFRQQGLGRTVLSALLDAARQRGIQDTYLHAQCHALGFYESVGYLAEGPVFDEAGIPHRLMRRPE